jgi:hypothetical protein
MLFQTQIGPVLLMIGNPYEVLRYSSNLILLRGVQRSSRLFQDLAEAEYKSMTNAAVEIT